MSRCVSHIQLLYAVGVPSELIAEHCIDIYTLAKWYWYAGVASELIFRRNDDYLRRKDWEKIMIKLRFVNVDANTNATTCEH